MGYLIVTIIAGIGVISILTAICLGFARENKRLNKYIDHYYIKGNTGKQIQKDSWGQKEYEHYKEKNK